MSDTWQQDTGETDPGFEQTLVNQLAREFLAEQRRARRWKHCIQAVYRLVHAGFSVDLPVW